MGRNRRHLSSLEFFSFIAIVIILGFIFAPRAKADETTLTWTQPIQNEDGTPLTDLAGIRIWQLIAVTTDVAVTSHVITGQKPGDYEYIATAYTTADPPVESKISNSAEKTSSGWLVTNIVVKIVTKIPGNFLLLGVGTVPLGTPCNQNVKVNDHYAVPLDDIVWSDPARNDGSAPLPLLVVAQCG